MSAVETPPTATISRLLGFEPARRIANPHGDISGALWRFQHQRSYELSGPLAEDLDVIAMPVSGSHHHTYFGDGRRKWSRVHPPFHFNMVVAGEHPRGVFAAEHPITYLHVYVPHALVERLATESGAARADGAVALIDPMCSHDPFVESVCREILREMTHGDGGSAMMFDVLSQQLLIRLLRQHSNLSGSSAFSARTGPGYRDWRLRCAIDYLEAHLSEDVGLCQVAREVGLSTARLATLFREGTGEPPHRWLMNRRLTRACELLSNPAISITEIAHRCGFASSQHLAAVMRRRLATTPTAYRRQLLGGTFA